MAVVLGTSSGFVAVAPTADPAGTNTTIDGSSVVTKDTSPAGATKITEIGWYRGGGTNAANFEVALYSDSAGAAATRLFVDNTNSDTAGGWVRVTVNWAISGSTAYWLAVQMDAHTGSSSIDTATSGGAGADVLTGQTTLNNPYGGGAVADADGMYAIYAKYSVPAVLTCNNTPFTLTGVNTGVKAGRKLPTAVTTFSETGVNTGLSIGHKLVTAVTAFAETSIATGFSVARKLLTAVTGFAVTGIDTGLSKGYLLSTAVTGFTLTSISTGFAVARKMITAVTGFTESGIDVGLAVARKLVTAVTSFSITGINIGLLRGYVLSTSNTAFTLTGKTISLVYSGAITTVNYVFNVMSGRVTKKVNSNYYIEL